LALSNGYNTSDIHLYIGECLLSKGEANKAIQEFLKAQKLNFKNTKIFYKLGLAYSEIGLYSEAITNLRKYIESDLNIPDIEEIKEIIYTLEQAL
ncbi:MAG: tetratricopeptide repeat protein, partial [Vampirovibrionia bacterium]